MNEWYERGGVVVFDDEKAWKGEGEEEGDGGRRERWEKQREGERRGKGELDEGRECHQNGEEAWCWIWSLELWMRMKGLTGVGHSLQEAFLSLSTELISSFKRKVYWFIGYC